MFCLNELIQKIFQRLFSYDGIAGIRLTIPKEELWELDTMQQQQQIKCFEGTGEQPK